MRGSGGFLLCLAVAGLLVWSPVVHGAEASPVLSPSVQLEPTAPPSADDVTRMIHELASIRDYDRLSWILNAIERQVPPVRAELLKKLDEQVQQLFQAEVELRTASALNALRPVMASSATSQEPKQESAAASRPNRQEDSASSTTDRAPWVSPQAYEDVQRQIEQTAFDSDPKRRMHQTITLSNLILGVEGREQREQLYHLLQQRSTQALQEQMQAAHKAIDEAILQDSQESSDSSKETNAGTF